MDRILEVYKDAIYDKADQRTESWFLVSSPWPPVIICISYILVCANCDKIMKNFQAMSLRPILVAYNFGLVILSVYMVYEFLVTSILSGYSVICQPVDYSDNPLAIRMAKVCWWYFFSKYIELADTVFFILRKKFNQVSFLHVYHHATMLINWWLAIKYVAGGNSFLIGVINSFIHVIMYSYYGIAAIGPHMQKYLWWKKYLTKLQLIQFFIMLVHSANILLGDCDFPKWISGLVVGYQVTLILLFGKFYFDSYRRKKD
uniref:elongation of very long chain fatty acids protein 4-like n=1 Tax=Styela clava TaxID=7725 RepID=UPI00193A2D60|nr:elongation of very long chain fatty acids protein 4-like [Styela clava]